MKNYLGLIFPLFALMTIAQNNRSALLPIPNHIEQLQSEPFSLTGENISVHPEQPELKFTATTLKTILRDRMRINIPLSGSRQSAIQLAINPRLNGKEHYKLKIDQGGVTISGASAAAVFYEVMAVDQILLGDVCTTNRKEVAAVSIDGAPRFEYRTLILDPARHFLPVGDVKFYIDQMVRYKYGVLQLHLTDDQGWRMEIKEHPKLTAGQPFYTQGELTDLIHYAAGHHIEIIPELDIPGHTVATLAAYPGLGCTHADTIEKNVGKTVDLMLCTNNGKVYTIYKDIIGEVGALFPSRYIHLGGDETVIEKNWTKCGRCQKMMKELKYEKASQLMIPLFDRMLSFVWADGKQSILQCELNNIHTPANDYLFPYPRDVILVSWRYGLTPTCQGLIRQHDNPLIMAPGEFAYLDCPQFKGDLPESNNWRMSITALGACYQFDPGYGRPTSKQVHILDVMGALWGEAIEGTNRVTYITYPRGLALAEAGWTQMEHRSWDSFKERLCPSLTSLMKNGVSIRVPFEIVKRG